ncbi:SDR family oxidoreductase [Paraburkholderia phytofirmans]|uniref:SDR family oxidoreductase n=1 Tax=Paraburkholderia phytofirmans TaxID=261302 RepID=UPI0038BA252F
MKQIAEEAAPSTKRRLGVQDLNGKVALISGDAGGIGAAIGQHLVNAGARVAVADLDATRAHQLAESLGDRAIALQLDVADEASWFPARNALESGLGPCDILISNAGVSYTGALDEISAQAWRWVYDVNVVGSLHGVRTFLPGMKARGREAHVALTSSITALHPFPEQGAYTTSKAARLNFASVLKRELANYPVGVSVICPGTVDTHIRENAVRARPTALTENFRTPSLSTKLGMSADFVGRAVVEAIRQNRFYVFTHADYAASVASDRDHMLAEMSLSADPNYREPVMFT